MKTVISKQVIVALAGLVILAIAMTALAQEATTTPDAAATTPEAVASEEATITPEAAATTTVETIATPEESISTSTGAVLGEATTTAATSSPDQEPADLRSSESRERETPEERASTPPAEDIPTDETTAPAEQATSTEPVAESSLATSTTSTVAEDVSALENSYFQKNGKYLQVLPNNQLPDYESGTVSDKLGATIPSDARVDIYTGPKGSGYQVTYTDGGTIYTVGFGPEADHRTYSYPAPPLSATSTEAVSEM